jgi:outer membrane protein insertion porin family
MRFKIDNNGLKAAKKILLIIAPLLLYYCVFPPFSYSFSQQKTITSIEVEGLHGMSQHELIDLIGIHEGDIFREKALSSGIRRAFRKGTFLDIKAVAEPYKDGVKLKYLVKEVPVIDKIIIEGNHAFYKRRIKKIFSLKEVETFDETLLDKAVRGLLGFYVKKGFPDAGIIADIVKSQKKGAVSIVIRIREGQPMIIKKVNVPYDITAHMNVSAGDILDGKEVEKDIKRIRDFYKRGGYIRPVIGPYSFHDGELVIPVEPGKRLEVAFINNDHVRRWKLMKEVPFTEYEAVTDELIDEAVDSIKRLYMIRGYYYAEVDTAVEVKEEFIKVSFFIFEGKKVILQDILFHGATIDPDTLKKVIPLKEDKPFNDFLTDSSGESLVMFYNALGYLNAEVKGIKKEFDKDGAGVNVIFSVKEGPQVRIKAIDIIGNSAVSDSEIRSVLQLYEDIPYNIVDIGDARHRAMSVYNRYGYLDAHVEVKSVVKDDEASLKFIITENRPSIIGKIIVRGNRKTNEKAIKREISVIEGENYNYEDVIRIKQRLYRLGLFSDVAIDILEPSISQYSGDEGIVRDMLITVKESKAGALELGMGYGDYEKLRGSVEINYRNMGGYNRQVGLRAEMNSVEDKYTFNYREPWLFNKPNLTLKASLSKENKVAINLDTKDVLYRLDKFSFVIGIEKELTKNLRASLNYEYSFNDTTDVDPGVILSREDTGTLAIGSISPSLFYDTRDNPFDPSSGSLNGIVVKFASKAYLSETEFIKGTFQSSWFFMLPKKIVFAFSIKGGAAHVFGDTEELPLIERFFLGGRTTVRGYSHDTLGPKGEDDLPTGGNIFALINGELRIPVRKGFGIVTFIDGGNVWRVTKDIEPDLKFTAGAGLRYSTPVGPVRIDYGHKLNRGPDESSGEIHFSFGHAF